MLCRRRVFWLAGLACLVSVGLPIAAALSWARGQAFREARQELDRRARALAENASRVLDEVATGLEVLAEVPLVCGEESVLGLRQVAFDGPEITETGLMDSQGRLFCTSWGAVDPPIRFELKRSKVA